MCIFPAQHNDGSKVHPCVPIIDGYGYFCHLQPHLSSITNKNAAVETADYTMTSELLLFEPQFCDLGLPTSFI